MHAISAEGTTPCVRRPGIIRGAKGMSRRFTDSEYRNIKRREREVIGQMLEELKKSKDKR